ncbi:carbohydrate sulfotransferase 14-like isoform X1 [Amphibalanus amphitrite]|uniref:carbohydrate sulfotransferase 14-like isoform X1 n=1 Tax=Amphibalanus amphitrite TaxID=1232801 RepID=UPI001C906381|nr:carbohydrate sulfotransferase 14-like isoform X1 [Amphibalanus amphitrite]XP_043189208.1 carbohydrate sulfotransferase 14-like isoform X1 [Amphibalanus amphitrite]
MKTAIRSVYQYLAPKFSKKAATCIILVAMALFTFACFVPSVELSTQAKSDSPEYLSSTKQQEERQLIMEEGCDTTKTMRSKDSFEQLLSNTQLLRNIIVNDEHRLMYCYIPKVSSTQWKKVMGVLSGRLPDIALSKIRGDLPHRRNVHRFLSEYSAEEIRTRLNSYTSFMFVRHPLERLVSGYRNKFGNAPLDGYFPSHFAADIKSRYGSGNLTSVGNDIRGDRRVTFEEFARWVSDPNPAAGARNEHWAPMAGLCRPCDIAYTVVGKMETLLEDARLVLRTANITSITFPVGFHSKTRSVAGDMLASLPKDVLRRVLSLYLEDFLVFGYHPSEVFVDNRTAELTAKLLFENVLFARK